MIYHPPTIDELYAREREECGDACSCCGDEFGETGPYAESLASPGTCVDCFINGYDEEEGETEE